MLVITWDGDMMCLHFPFCLHVRGVEPSMNPFISLLPLFVEPYSSMVTLFWSASMSVEPYPRIVPSIEYIDWQSLGLHIIFYLSIFFVWCNPLLFHNAIVNMCFYISVLCKVFFYFFIYYGVFYYHITSYHTTSHYHSCLSDV